MRDILRVLLTFLSPAPKQPEAIPDLLKEITKGVDNLTTRSEEDCKDLVVKCQALARAIETPRKTMVDYCWGQVVPIGAIGFGVDSGLWVLMAQNGDGP
ncbi:O-methyltransferase family 2 [Penicillium expansum]|nr:O-methyltransferase family 2 [Penicillium expansum]